MPLPVVPGTKKGLAPVALEQTQSRTAPGTDQEPSSLVLEQMPLLVAPGTASQFGDFIFDVLAFSL